MEAPVGRQQEHAQERKGRNDLEVRGNLLSRSSGPEDSGCLESRSHRPPAMGPRQTAPSLVPKWQRGESTLTEVAVEHLTLCLQHRQCVRCRAQEAGLFGSGKEVRGEQGRRPRTGIRGAHHSGPPFQE